VVTTSVSIIAGAERAVADNLASRIQVDEAESIRKRAKRASIASQKTRRLRAARPDSSRRKERLFGMTFKLTLITVIPKNRADGSL